MTGPADRTEPTDPGDSHSGWARYHPAFLVLLGLATITGVVRFVLAVVGGLGWLPILISSLMVALLASGVVWQLLLMRREERRR